MWFFSTKKKGKSKAGITLSNACIHVSVIDQSGKTPELTTYGCYRINEGQSQLEVLNVAVQEHQLKEVPCVLVMEPDSYSLLQLEAPKVESSELASALRWSVKDMIDYHIDDAVIDAFELPSSNRAHSQKMIYAIVTRKAILQERVDLLHSAGLEISAIDITEMALRNLSQVCSKDEHPITSLFMLPDRAFIEVTQGDTLFFSRRIDNISYNPEDVKPGFFAPNQDDILTLEVQRSMDHFESQFGRGRTQKLKVLPNSANHEQLIASMQEELMTTTEAIDISEAVIGIDKVPAEQIADSLPALGGALRV